MHRWHRFFPFLHWLQPNVALLRSEALAGLTVGLMAFTQAAAVLIVGSQ